MSKVIETLRRLQCSDAACGDLRIAMGAKLAIYEIERLTAERDEARRSCCEFAAIVAGADDTAGMESGRFYEIAMKYMRDRGWDCFKQEDGK